ncbi:MAG: choice-of-anchor Q domain-containing protein [Pseudomonadota bacterium]
MYKPYWNTSLVGLLLLCMSLPALAQVNWPNAPAPCDNPASLQLCIDSQPDGAIIEINANSIAPINDLSVDQNLTIRAAAGFTPMFELPMVWNFRNDSGPVSVTIEGLTFAGLEMEVRHSDGDAALDFAFRSNEIQEVAGRGIRIVGSSESASEPIRFVIEDNVIRAFNRFSSVVTAFSTWTSGNEGLVRNNLFESVNILDGAVLDFNGPIGRLTDMNVDVIGNRFEGQRYDAAVFMDSNELGRLDGRIINNLAFGQDGGENIVSVVVVAPSDSTAEGDVWIINNTLVDNVSGITVTSASTPDVRTFVYNNIVTNSIEQNFRFLGDSVVVNDYNLGFAPGNPDEFTPGPNFLALDPLFDGSPQLHAASPAIDSGDSSVVPLDIVSDLAGNDRIKGASVDRGAFEFEPVLPESVAVPTLNAAGLIVLILLCLGMGPVFRPRHDAKQDDWS